jgi:hypothetical protein
VWLTQVASLCGSLAPVNHFRYPIRHLFITRSLSLFGPVPLRGLHLDAFCVIYVWMEMDDGCGSFCLFGNKGLLLNSVLDD